MNARMARLDYFHVLFTQFLLVLVDELRYSLVLLVGKNICEMLTGHTEGEVVRMVESVFALPVPAFFPCPQPALAPYFHTRSPH